VHCHGAWLLSRRAGRRPPACAGALQRVARTDDGVRRAVGISAAETAAAAAKPSSGRRAASAAAKRRAAGVAAATAEPAAATRRRCPHCVGERGAVPVGPAC
jgi:hypothetical protein